MPSDFSGKEVQSTTSGEVFGGDTALPCTAVTTDLCRAVVSHQGAQLLSFQPQGGKEWLWLSPLAQFASGSAIRGGIPLCLPWFGRHQSGDGLPKHGFCRLRDWDLVAVDRIDQAVCLRFEYASTEADLALFPWRFRAEIQYRLSNNLVLELSIENLDETPMPLSFAMHSYFAVSSLANTRIEGIDQAEYLDNTRDLQRGLQREALVFGKEVDKVFPGLGGEQRLTDKLAPRYVAGRGCDTAIIWNPGNDSLADVGSHFNEFVCLERGIAFDDAQTLAPGHRWEALMSVSDKGRGLLV